MGRDKLVVSLLAPRYAATALGLVTWLHHEHAARPLIGPLVDSSGRPP
jgi:hypothetical protein